MKDKPIEKSGKEDGKIEEGCQDGWSSMLISESSKALVGNGAQRECKQEK